MDIVRIQRGSVEILAIPVCRDNLVYLVCQDGQAVLIDAGSAAPVRACLAANHLRLCNILLTHRHADHTAGATALRADIQQQNPSAVGSVEMLSVPGHTANDAAFYFPAAAAVFTGDCLINGACGRIFGGSATELYESLMRIAQLPVETLVLGGHDYLADNLRFGLSVEPDNDAIRNRLALYQRDPAAALFVSLEEEKKTNPFLRATTAESFAALRKAKDRF